jgi:hypothetical protein
LRLVSFWSICFRTILKQEASVSVNLPTFTGYCESAFMNIYQVEFLH